MAAQISKDTGKPVNHKREVRTPEQAETVKRLKELFTEGAKQS